jgi:hypothetical protein
MKGVIRVVSFLRCHGDISVQSLDGKECGASGFHLFWICNSKTNLVVNNKDEILSSFTCPRILCLDTLQTFESMKEAKENLCFNISDEMIEISTKFKERSIRNIGELFKKLLHFRSSMIFFSMKP